MKARRHIAYLLFVVSMLMLGVPVIPHHHHTDGLLCMKNDLGEDCCETQSDPDDGPTEHCCCHTDCITTHFFQQLPTIDTGWLHPAPAGDACFLPALLPLPAYRFAHPIRQHNHTSYYYLESLHSTLIARAKGLRAPPSILS